MVEQGEETVLVSEGIGLSDVAVKEGNEVVVHGEGMARGPSRVKEGQEVVMVDDGLAQTAGGLPEYIRLGELTSSDYLLYVGDTATLELPVTNEDTENHDFRVEWKENQSTFNSETKTINDRSTALYTQNVQKDNAGEFKYQGSQSNIISLSWLNVKPGPLVADPYVLKPEQTSTLSMTVDNPGSDPVDVKVEFFNEQDTKLGGSTKTISASGSVTYSLDRTFDFPAEVDYYARLTEVDTGVDGTSRNVTVKWTNAGLLADWGDGLKEIGPNNVGDFIDWYGYQTTEGPQATHGHTRAFGTAVEVLDDGSSTAISITHHDGNGPQTTGLPFLATTSFSFRDGSFGGYIEQDDAPSEERFYSSSGMGHQFNGQNTDGAIIGFSPGDDITISVSGENTDGITFWNEGVLAGVSVRIVNNR